MKTLAMQRSDTLRRMRTKVNTNENLEFIFSEGRKDPGR